MYKKSWLKVALGATLSLVTSLVMAPDGIILSIDKEVKPAAAEGNMVSRLAALNIAKRK